MWKQVISKVMAMGLVFCLAAGVTGCGASKEGATENSQESSVQSSAVDSNSAEKKVVRIGAVGQSNVISESGGIAQKMGYLEEELAKEGYEPKIVGFAQAGPAINEAFSAGEIDMAVYGDLPATVCKASGTDTTIFATNNSQCQMAILVQKDSGIASAADLKGHKVIVARGTIYHQYFESLIQDAGIDEKDIEQINTFSDASSVMSSGDADALITSTSIAYYMEEKGIGKVIETTVEHPEWTSQFFAVGKSEYLKANPNAAKAFIRALLRAQEYAHKNPEEAYKLIAGFTEGYTEDIIGKVYSYDESFDYFSPEISKENLDKLKNLEKFLEEAQLISSPVDIDSFVDTSYYEEVIAEQK